MKAPLPDHLTSLLDRAILLRTGSFRSGGGIGILDPYGQGTFCISALRLSTSSFRLATIPVHADHVFFY